MKDLIEARGSDVYDVLAYVAFSTETQTRWDRVKYANTEINAICR
ncbi:MAG: type I restriction enzyme R subunit [Arenicella sp.]|jgi:type I restriction enzyme R subunit